MGRQKKSLAEGNFNQSSDTSFHFAVTAMGLCVPEAIQNVMFPSERVHVNVVKKLLVLIKC